MESVKCRDYEYKRVSSGSVVGRLTVLEVVGKSKNGSRVWKCSCSCGGFVDVISSSLNSGLVQSCGCLYDEVKGKQALTHGKHNSREYRAWCAMKQRCYYEKHDFFKDYGGRGISVCESWKNSFEEFYEDMGECPKGYSLDRVDVEKDYCKDNCKWSSNSEQGFNTRKKCTNTSGKTGVSYHKLADKWQASICVENVQIYLGLFQDFEDAVRAREEAELKYFNFTKE